MVKRPVTQLIKRSFETSVFPDSLKLAHVVPVHKKNSTCTMLAGNYRTVSILPAISQFFERAIDTQVVDFFESSFHIFLSAFRARYSC